MPASHPGREAGPANGAALQADSTFQTRSSRGPPLVHRLSSAARRAAGSRPPSSRTCSSTPRAGTSSRAAREALSIPARAVAPATQSAARLRRSASGIRSRRLPPPRRRGRTPGEDREGCASSLPGGAEGVGHALHAGDPARALGQIQRLRGMLPARTGRHGSAAPSAIPTAPRGRSRSASRSRSARPHRSGPRGSRSPPPPASRAPTRRHSCGSAASRRAGRVASAARAAPR